MGFAEPSPTDGENLVARDLVNHLLLVWVVQYHPHVQTQYTEPGKRSDAVVIDLVDVSGGPRPMTRQGQAQAPLAAGTLGRRCMWYNSKLVDAFRNRIWSEGDMPLLGTIGVGMSKGGNTPPWVFNSLTSEEGAVAAAEAWLEANPNFKPSEPEALPVPRPQPAQQQMPYPQQRSQHHGWPQGAQPVQQGWGHAPQLSYVAPQQQEAPPQWVNQQQGWSQPPTQANPEGMTVLDQLRRGHENNPTMGWLSNHPDAQQPDPPF